MGKPWAARSARRTSLPREFFRNREIVLRRDGHQCQLRFPDRCIGVANQSDHIGDRNDHRIENMRAACAPCHAHRSATQGGAAEGAARRARQAAQRRAPERHPGLCRP